MPAALLSVLFLAGAPTPSPAETTPGEAVAIRVARDAIEFRVGKELVTRYVTDPKAAKPYFWPVHAAPGVPVTRPWPMDPAAKGEATDHKHQKSIWFCHGDVIPEGVKLKTKSKHAAGVDFWSEEEGHGVIRCVRVGEPRAAGAHGRVTTANEWRTADGEKVLDETRTLHLYDAGGARLLVFEIDLHASVAPVTFGDTKEGSLGVRVRESLRGDKKGRLTNAEGRTGEGALNNVARTGCWGMKSAWCDDSGPAEGVTAGIALFADPGNPVPTYWHCRDYGLLAANPFGGRKSGFPDARDRKDLVRLAKGEHLKLRYGVYTHRGAAAGKVAEGYERFVKLKGGE